MENFKVFFVAPKDTVRKIKVDAFNRNVPVASIYRILLEKYVAGEVKLTDDDLSKDRVKWGKKSK